MSKTTFELLVHPIENMPTLVSNIDELKKALEVSLVKYQNLVVTEDGIKDAKEDRANLNKLKKSISDERITQKKMFLAPFEEFETKCKEVEKLINDTSSSIDVQIKAFDEAEKEAKRKEIAAIYKNYFGLYERLIPLEKIFDERWLNKGTTLKKIDEEIKYIKDSADIHLKNIEDLKSEFEEQLKDKYFETLDITAVLQENARLLEQKEMLAEFEARKEAERAARENVEPVVIEKEELSNSFEEIIANDRNVTVEVKEEEIIYTIVFKVECTSEQLHILSDFMKNNSIRYGRVKKWLK